MRARGYFVSTVGLNEEVIRKYIREQKKNDLRQEKSTFKPCHLHIIYDRVSPACTTYRAVVPHKSTSASSLPEALLLQPANRLSAAISIIRSSSFSYRFSLFIKNFDTSYRIFHRVSEPYEDLSFYALFPFRKRVVQGSPIFLPKPLASNYRDSETASMSFVVSDPLQYFYTSRFPLFPHMLRHHLLQP